MTESVFQQLGQLPEAARERVVVLRHWHSPEITVWVDQDKIAIYTSIHDFLEALVLEIKQHPLAIFSRARLRAAIHAAARAAIEKVKESTAQVM